jgi:hypothetical protein
MGIGNFFSLYPMLYILVKSTSKPLPPPHSFPTPTLFPLNCHHTKMASPPSLEETSLPNLFTTDILDFHPLHFSDPHAFQLEATRRQERIS